MHDNLVNDILINKTKLIIQPSRYFILNCFLQNFNNIVHSSIFTLLIYIISKHKAFLKSDYAIDNLNLSHTHAHPHTYI